MYRGSLLRGRGRSIHVSLCYMNICEGWMFTKIGEKVYERSGKNLFWLIKNSGEILDKLKARDFNATSLSTYDFLLFTLLYLII